MADRILVMCPGCSAKLAVSDASKLGKKIRCSKCSEVFVAKAASSSGTKSAKPAKSAPPAKTKKKSDDDEFNFDDMEMEDKSEFDDEESEDEAPVAKSKAKATSKTAVKKGNGKGKGKSSGNNLPLIIGGSVAAVLIVGVGLYFLLSGGEAPAVAPVAQQPAGIAPAVAPAAQNFPGDRSLALKWLPQETELIVHLKVGDLWIAPLLQGFLGSPQTKPLIQQMQQFTGLAPTDIESITIGMRDLQGMQGQAMMLAMGGQAPKNPQALIVVRSKKPVDPAALSSQIAQAGAATGMKLADHSGKQYVEAPAAKPGDKAMGAWFADTTTLIGGPTDELFAAMDRGETITPRNEFRAVDPSPHLLFVIAPKNPQSMSQSTPLPPGTSPAAAEILKTIQESMSAVSFGVSVRGGADLQTSLVCKDTAGSSKLKTNLEALIAETKPAFAAKKATTPPLLFELGEMLLNNVQITEQNQVVKLASNVPDSAQQKLEQLPTVLMGAMMFGGNPFAGGGTPPGLSIGGNAGSFSDGLKKPGETEAVPATNAGELPPGSTLTAKTAWQQFPEFGPNGQQSLNMQLLVDLKGELISKASGFGRVSVKSIATVGGGSVKLAKHQSLNTPDPATTILPFDPAEGFSFEHPEETLRITIPFEPPNPPAAQLTTIIGEFKVQTADKSEEIEVDDVRLAASKPLDNPALKAAETTLTLKVEDTPFGKREIMTLTFAAGVSTSQIAMTDAAKEGFTTYATQNPLATKPTFLLMPLDDSGKLPEKFKLTFKIHSGLKEISVPFRFENVPLPKPETMPKVNTPK